MSEMENPAWWPDYPYPDKIFGRQFWDKGAEAMYAARQWQIDTYEAVLKDLFAVMRRHGSLAGAEDEISRALTDVMGQEAFENWMNNEMEV